MCFEKSRPLDGLRGNAILRQRSINSYYGNPNYCLECGKVIQIPSGGSVYHTRVKKFCNRSCAASSNNRGVRRHGDGSKECSGCGAFISRHNRSGLCKDCYSNSYWGKPLNDLVLSDVVYRKHHRAAAFSYVRERARFWLKNNREMRCEYCGYGNHVECAHVKAINTFSEDTLILEINHPDNLLWLCPNHHWELEFGKIITLDAIYNSPWFHGNL